MLRYNFDDVHVRVSTSTRNKKLLSEKEKSRKKIKYKKQV